MWTAPISALVFTTFFPFEKTYLPNESMFFHVMDENIRG